MSKALVRFTVSTCEGAEIPLEVGSHSPIWVIKEELQRQTKRPVEELVLCLLNDKGDEGELLEEDRATVEQCGIVSGSTLFLSFLGASGPGPAGPRAGTPVGTPRIRAVLVGDADDGAMADGDGDAEALVARAATRAREECRAWTADLQQQRQHVRDEQHRDEQRTIAGYTDPSAPNIIDVKPEPRPHMLTTQKAPREAEHSFNGVMFNVQAKAPYEITIDSLHVGGMLGTMSVFACGDRWCSDEESLHSYGGYGRQNYAVRDADQWELVYRGAHKPMWDSTTEIVLDKKVTLLPGQTKALYVHSALPDDLGLQYQTTGQGVQVADEDEFIRLLPGVGHTSSIPFDRDYGWYRHPRSLAGRLGYEATLRTWHPRYHKQFPESLRLAIKTMMLAQKREESPLSLLPQPLLYKILENCEWDFFGLDESESESEEEEEEEPRGRGYGARGHYGRRHPHHAGFGYGGGGGGGGGGGPMIVVDYDGQQVQMPMDVLMRMMGGDVAALQGLMQGDDDDDEDDGESDDGSVSSGDSLDDDWDEPGHGEGGEPAAAAAAPAIGGESGAAAAQELLSSDDDEEQEDTAGGAMAEPPQVVDAVEVAAAPAEGGGTDMEAID